MVDTLDPANLDAVFKAYDVRGLVPDQLDERARPRVPARRSCASSARTPSSSGTTCGPARPGMAGGVRRRRRRGRRRRGDDRAGLHRPALLRLRPPRRTPARCSPRATTPPQYNGIKLCRAGAEPVGRETGLARDPRRRRRRAAPAAPRQGAIDEHDVLEAYAAHLLTLAPVAGRRLKVVVDAGNGMAGLHRARRVRPARRPTGRPGADVLRARRHLPEPRGQPDRAGQPRRPPAARGRRGRRPRPGLRRRRRPVLRRRRARRARSRRRRSPR